MITERCRMSIADTVLVFLAAFVLVSIWMAPSLPLQTVIVSANPAESVAYSVPIDDPELSSIRNRLESYGVATDHPLLGTNRWIADASQYYVSAAPRLWQQTQTESPGSSRSSVRQVSHQTLATGKAAPHQAAARGWNRIATEAQTRIDQMKQHQSVQLQKLKPAPVKLGAVVHAYWTRTSLIAATVMASIVLLVVTVWKRVCPTRDFQSLSVSREPTVGLDHQWIAVEVLPEWIRLHQTNGAILRRGFVAVLVFCAIASVCVRFTSGGWTA